MREALRDAFALALAMSLSLLGVLLVVTLIRVVWHLIGWDL